MKSIDENTVFYRFDGDSATAVYAGGLTGLTNVSDELEWTKDEAVKEFGLEECISLKEIAEQLKDKHTVITVVHEGSMYGSVLQWGNYSDKKWYLIGDLIGYA